MCCSRSRFRRWARRNPCSCFEVLRLQLDQAGLHGEEFVLRCGRATPGILRRGGDGRAYGRRKGFRAAGGTGRTFDGFLPSEVLFFAFECCASTVLLAHGHPRGGATHTSAKFGSVGNTSRACPVTGTGLGPCMSALSGTCAASASRVRSMQARGNDEGSSLRRNPPRH